MRLPWPRRRTKSVVPTDAPVKRKKKRVKPKDLRTRRRRLADRLAHLLMFGAGAFLAILVFHFVFMPITVDHGKEIAVPDVVGLSFDDANQVLQKVELSGAVVSERVSLEWPRGTVLEQDPPPYLRTRKERGVGLVLSLGRGVVDVPDIIGESLRHAELILAREGIPVGHVSRRPSEEPAEQVLALSPSPGSTCIRGRSVDVLISSGPEKPAYLMPDLRGGDSEETASALRRSGFLVEVVYPMGAVAIGGPVVSHEPVRGHRIEDGDQVLLYVGRTDE